MSRTDAQRERLISSKSPLHPSFDSWKVRSTRGGAEDILTTRWMQEGLDKLEDRSDIDPALLNAETRGLEPSGLIKALRGVASTLVTGHPHCGAAQRFLSMVPRQPSFGNLLPLRIERFGRSSCPFCYLKSRSQEKSIAAAIAGYVQRHHSLPHQLDRSRSAAAVSDSHRVISAPMGLGVVLHAEPDLVLLTDLGAWFLICATGSVPGDPPANALLRARVLATLAKASSEKDLVSVALLVVDATESSHAGHLLGSADTMLTKAIPPCHGRELLRLAAAASRESWISCTTCQHHLN